MHAVARKHSRTWEERKTTVAIAWEKQETTVAIAWEKQKTTVAIVWGRTENYRSYSLWIAEH